MGDKLSDADKRRIDETQELIESLPGLASFITVVASARIDHHAPCVPECNVCYTYCEKCDMVHHSSGVHDDVRETTSVYTDARTSRTDTYAFKFGEGA